MLIFQKAGQTEPGPSMKGCLMKAGFLLRLATMFLVAGLAGGSFARCAKASTISGSLTADNAFFAYISTSNSVRGALVASGNAWGTTFSFSNFALTAGRTYYLQIEAINYGGPGAILGDFSLSDTGFQFANGTQHLLTDTTNWLAIYNDSNNNPDTQQPWVTPTGGVTSQGANGVSPWGTRSGISTSALWIDGTTNGLTTCGDCTVDFSTTITSNGSTVPEPATFGYLAAALAGLCVTRLRRRFKV
jgi:hypothetical protein